MARTNRNSNLIFAVQNGPFAGRQKKERKLLSTFFEHRIPSLDFESWLDKEIYDVNSWGKLFPQARRGHIIMEKKHHGGGEQKRGKI